MQNNWRLTNSPPSILSFKWCYIQLTQQWVGTENKEWEEKKLLTAPTDLTSSLPLNNIAFAKISMFTQCCRQSHLSLGKGSGQFRRGSLGRGVLVGHLILDEYCVRPVCSSFGAVDGWTWFLRCMKWLLLLLEGESTSLGSTPARSSCSA